MIRFARINITATPIATKARYRAPAATRITCDSDVTVKYITIAAYRQRYHVWENASTRMATHGNRNETASHGIHVYPSEAISLSSIKSVESTSRNRKIPYVPSDSIS